MSICNRCLRSMFRPCQTDAESSVCPNLQRSRQVGASRQRYTRSAMEHINQAVTIKQDRACKT